MFLFYFLVEFVANAKAVANQKLHEKRCQLMMAEKILTEYREMLASLKDTQVWQNQIVLNICRSYAAKTIST